MQTEILVKTETAKKTVAQDFEEREKKVLVKQIRPTNAFNWLFFNFYLKW